MSDKMLSEKSSRMLAAFMYLCPVLLTEVANLQHWPLPIALAAGAAGVVLAVLVLLAAWRDSFVRFHALQSIALVIFAVVSWGIAMLIGMNWISQGRTGTPHSGSGDTAAMLFIGVLLIASVGGAAIFGSLLLYFAIQAGRGRWPRLWLVGNRLYFALNVKDAQPLKRNPNMALNPDKK